MQVTFRPFCRQGRKDADEAKMALDEHFTDSGCSSVVSVNLERCVRAEKIRICSAGRPYGLVFAVCRVEKASEELEGSVSVFKSCPEVHLPCAAPSCSLVAAAVERDPACLGKFRCLCRGYLISRMQSIKV